MAAGAEPKAIHDPGGQRQPTPFPGHLHAVSGSASRATGGLQYAAQGAERGAQQVSDTARTPMFCARLFFDVP